MNHDSSQMIFKGFEQMIADAAQAVVEHLKNQNTVKLWSAKQLAEMFDMEEKAVYKLNISRVKPYGEDGAAVRFHDADVQIWIEENKHQPKQPQIGKAKEYKFMKPSAVKKAA